MKIQINGKETVSVRYDVSIDGEEYYIIADVYDNGVEIDEIVYKNGNWADHIEEKEWDEIEEAINTHEKI